MKILGKITLLVLFGLTSVIAMEMNSKSEEKKVVKIKVKKQQAEQKEAKEVKTNEEKDFSDFKKVEK